MFKTKTVIVVGAGASCEAEIPDGRGLTSRIANRVAMQVEHYQVKPNDWTYKTAIDHAMQASGESDFNPYLQASRLIQRAMPQVTSIDNFIDMHRADKRVGLCGKLAIGQCILQAEGESLLKVEQGNVYNTIDFIRAGGTWFNRFVQLLTQNCTTDDLAKRLRTITFIVFNYDRCIEHFIFRSLQNVYQLDAEQAAALMTNLTIYHPYGRVGRLPWEKSTTGQSIGFGDKATAEQLLKLSLELKTFSEELDSASKDIASIREAIVQAPTIVFLGFGFHQQNVDLILPANQIPQRDHVVTVIGTAKGMSKTDAELVTNGIRGRISRSITDVHIHNMTCSDLFDEYWRTLALR